MVAFDFYTNRCKFIRSLVDLNSENLTDLLTEKILREVDQHSEAAVS